MNSPGSDDQHFYNSRIFNTYLKLIRERYPYINSAELLSHAGMELYQVEDEGHWFTQEQADLFYERLLTLTGNPNIAREAGRFAASPDSIGVMRQYILSHVDPATAYQIIGRASPNFTRSSLVEASRIGRNSVEITATPVEGAEEKAYQCENRLGYLDAVSLVFKYRLPVIEHPECLFKGGKVCRYIVSWQESRSAFWRQVRNYAALMLAALSAVLLPTLNPVELGFYGLAGVLLVLLIDIYSSRYHFREMNAALSNLRESNENLLDQINFNYNNARFISELGQALGKQMEVDGILSGVIESLSKRLDFDRGMILLVNEDRTRLEYKTGYGYSRDQERRFQESSFRLDRHDSKGVFVVCVRQQKPFLINDLDEILGELSPRSVEFARKIGSRSFICCPIVYEGESLGLLAVDNLTTKRPLLQRDISLLMGVTQEIGISMHNAMLIEAKISQFKSLLQTLAASIDARDPLTAGHSTRVTDYALGICREMGMSRDYCEMVRVASLLHDYGKIGIRDSILKKNGVLTAEERFEIETHAEKTREILKQVNFDGFYKEVPEIAGSHHEKVDGTGYPLGLKGDEIPLGARIIAVADVFEALTSRRHYRGPMPVQEALDIIDSQRGKHFDSSVVDAFFRYLEGLKSGDGKPQP